METSSKTELKLVGLLMDQNKVEEVGLLNGKMGLAIYFFQLARTYQQEEYKQYASQLLDEVADSLNMQMPIDFATGLTGIGWGIEYLIQNQFIEGDADDILEEMDYVVLNYFISNPQTIATILSIGHYYIARLIYRIKEEESETVLNLKYNVILLIDELERQMKDIGKNIEIEHLLNELYKLNIFNFKVLKLKRKLQESNTRKL